MSPIESVFSASFSQALGSTLLHFIWQGTLVAGALWGALRLLRRHTARLRYGVAAAALGLLLVLPAITLVWHLQPGSAGEAVSVASPLLAEGLTDGRTAPESPIAEAERGGWLTRGMTHGLPWVLTVWMVGVFVLSLRWLTGGVYTAQLRRRGHREVGQKWQQMLAALSAQMGITRTVALYTSGRVQVPTVVGWFRPVVLLPVSVFTGLSPQQIEMILAHELAHIRRHDYLVNMLQTIAETLLFYHPGVWWISRQLRVEREHCCDDLVVAVCGDAFTYAEALTKLERVRHRRPALALAATGGSLLNRIHRLLGTSAETTTRSARWTAGLVLLGALLIGTYATTPLHSMWQKATHQFGDEPVQQRVERRHKVKIRPVIKFNPITVAPITIDPITIDPITIDPITIGTVEIDPITVGPITVERVTTEPITVEVTIPEEYERVVETYQLDGRYAFGVLEEEEDEEQGQEQALDEFYQRYENTLMSSINFMRRQAVEDFARTDDDDRVTILVRIAFEDGSLSVQMEALDGLRNLPRGEGYDALLKIAETHPRDAMRNEAVQWLGRLGVVKAVPALERLAFEDGSRSVQMEALDALRTLPDGAGLEALESIARSHPRERMRSEATEWLGRL